MNADKKLNPIHPGEVLKEEFMVPLCLSANQLALRLHVPEGRITKQGSGLMRRILVQDAWMAVRISSVFRSRYNSILKRKGKRVAVVAIARMLAEVAYRILRDKTEYKEELLTLG